MGMDGRLVEVGPGQGALAMGTLFDAMEEPARHFFPALPPAVQRGRTVLLGIMTQAGFQASDTEWWHYQLPGARSYPLLQDDRVRPAERRDEAPGPATPADTN